MRQRHSQRGFSLVTAIFIVTVLASLGAFLATMSGVSHQTPALGYAGAQAYHAARSGLEWGIERAIVNGGGCNAAFPLNGFNVVVNCTQTTHPDGPVDVDIYRINAIATRGNPGELAYARRELQAIVSPDGPQ